MVDRLAVLLDRFSVSAQVFNAGALCGINTLEADHHDKQGRPTVPARQSAGDARQLSLFGPESHPLLDELKGLNIDNMTPLQAMQELARLREQAQ